MANLSLKHIYKVYPNGTKAVNDFNMQIEDKEFIVFVGPSGCGKSTTLRMIAGLEEISAGELKIGDVVVNGLEPKDRDIAMVFQNYALYPHMTIYDNIAFGLQMRKVPKDEIDRRVREAAEILGITDYLKKKPKEMSGGQRQRVALGRAIVREPKVMLLDEPLSNLDAKLRTQMRSEIVKLHKKLQTTFIYVTHDQVEAMTMGTRIVVMKDGFIKQIDTPKNLYKYPANKFVAGFIGTPQMNFFEGTILKDGDRVCINFANSQARLTVPYSALTKVIPHYLDGEHKVTIGFRAEDISLDPVKVEQSQAVVKVKVSHTEELGTETLVYGDINLGGDDFTDTGTRVIIKSGGFKEYESGEVVEAAFDIGAIHLFDSETEESILPRVPEYNYLNCTVSGNKLRTLGTEFDIPPAISCDDGEYELLLPVTALANGETKAKVIGCEKVSGSNLLSLDINGVMVFTISDLAQSNGEANIGIDFKQITLRRGGENVVQPLPLVNSLDATFIMEKVAERDERGKRKKKALYSFVIEGEKFVCPDEVCAKMFAAFSGRKVFNTSYTCEFSPYDFTVGESGITATIVGELDYSSERFLKCSLNGKEVYVRTDKPLTGEVKLIPDLNTVSVIEKDRQIRIV